jgi:hypothetical protein
MTRRLATGVTSAVVLLGSIDATQQSSPVFRGGIDLVTVDIRVLDKNGRPAAGLGADDFQSRLMGNVHQSQPSTMSSEGGTRV